MVSIFVWGTIYILFSCAEGHQQIQRDTSQISLQLKCIHEKFGKNGWFWKKGNQVADIRYKEQELKKHDLLFPLVQYIFFWFIFCNIRKKHNETSFNDVAHKHKNVETCGH